MKLKSFVREGLGLTPIEIELTLCKGLPGIKFLGLPDHLIKESEVRIQTALRNQGFDLPPAQTILVQLRPMEGRKTSNGLDLAIAAGFLWMTQQIPSPEDADWTVYAELDFQGRVRAPSDLLDVQLLALQSRLLTGPNQNLLKEHFVARELKDLKSLEFVAERHLVRSWSKPSIEGWSVPAGLARLLSVAAVGEHHLLMAGPPGTGKSTAATLLTGLVADPWLCEVHQMEQIGRYYGEHVNWRPVRRPHHTASQIAIVGGSGRVLPGEVTKAHGGILVLDELLEFDVKVQETLREPLETGWIRLSRGTSAADFPARFILVATTNLCPCGQLTPRPSHKCRCTNARRRKYVDKMSGPFLERFSVIGLADEWDNGVMCRVQEIEKRVAAAHSFICETRQQNIPNQLLPEIEIMKHVDRSEFKKISEQIPSRRRIANWLKVSRSFADLELSVEIKRRHMQEAWELSESGIRKLSLDLQKYS